MHTEEPMEPTARELLVLDTNTFVAEIGLMSRAGSALKHYLYRRGMQLVVPEVVVEEYERHLIKRARQKRTRIEGDLQWLARFCGEIGGWRGLTDEAIAERAKALSQADHLGGVVVPEASEIRRRAELRDQAELPPSHKKSQLADCRIWEQCLELLTECHVVFVSNDGDFRGYRNQDSLHPTLQTEADAIIEDRSLTFHRTMESLLSGLRSEIQPIPNDVVFSFVYESITSVVQELQSNSGCYPKEVGNIKQTLLTTDQAEIIEVRLEIEDVWASPDEENAMDFHLSGSCHYRLADKKLCDLTASSVNLLTQQPDGSIGAVKGSVVNLSGHAYVGAPPIRPEPAELEVET